MPTRCQHRTTLCPSQPLWHPEKKSSRRDSSVGSPCVYGSSQHNQSRRTSFSFFVFNKPPHLIQAFFSTNITRTSAIILQGILSKTARGPRERPTSHDEDLRDLHKQFSCSLSHIICCERGERETRKRRPRKHELSVVSCLVTLRVHVCRAKATELCFFYFAYVWRRAALAVACCGPRLFPGLTTSDSPMERDVVFLDMSSAISAQSNSESCPLICEGHIGRRRGGCIGPFDRSRVTLL